MIIIVILIILILIYILFNILKLIYKVRNSIEVDKKKYIRNILDNS